MSGAGEVLPWGRFEMRILAGRGSVFSRDALAKQVGKLVPVNGDIRRVLDVVVSDDGTYATVTFDAPSNQEDRG